ncbi:unnamed protein product [Pleuronectes platessa]|uniref:Uncharacterized protein n=1 Tax=Pleuronectes platessa TaxID=8262 RepID=A0A9N7YJ93_PLEPL|nr:unnamed protein product [Pleuronectes platessa]
MWATGLETRALLRTRHGLWHKAGNRRQVARIKLDSGLGTFPAPPAPPAPPPAGRQTPLAAHLSSEVEQTAAGSSAEKFLVTLAESEEPGGGGAVWAPHLVRPQLLTSSSSLPLTTRPPPALLDIIMSGAAPLFI